MIVRKLCVDELSIQEILSVLDIAQGVSLHRPDWQKLRQELSRFELCGIFDGAQLVGFAQIDSRCSYVVNSIQLVALRYCWQYNQEAQIAEMIQLLGTLYHDAQWMLLDVDAKWDFNVPLYRTMGFQVSTMRSPRGKNHLVLICPMEALCRE